MKKLNIKEKKIILSVASVFLVIAIFVATMFLINEINLSRNLNKKEKVEKIYATVLKSENNMLVVKSLNTEHEMILESNDAVNKGDIIVFEYDKKNDEIFEDTLTIIASKEDYTETVKTTSKITTTTSKTTSMRSPSTTSKNSVNKDEMVLSYVSTSNKEVEENTFKEKSKEAFITLVDFIFYDGKIAGVTWDEISTKTKAKVIYYTLIIDSKIEKKFPNYKDKLSDKYNHIKEKLIAKYMDITTNICEKHSSECAFVKEDFKLLKSSLNLTWDIIKSSFKYGYDKSVTYLKNWYEVFSGK